jgi:hypothetical protein
LWGTTRQKKPLAIDRRDVPDSLYGEQDLNRMMSTGTPVHEPTARIVPSNTGYSTNITMDAMDGQGIEDYSQIANTMREISRAALGIDRANVDLHIRDESRRMSPGSIQREFSEYLRK